MGVHGFIIADTGNIDAQSCKTFTGLQKCADMVWHGSCICLFHDSITVKEE